MRIWAAMSGGVDSSTAAAFLVKEGHDVEGVYMDLWSDRRVGDPATHSKPMDAPWRDAQRVADCLGIPLRVISLREAFRRRIVDAFIDEYRAGRTPNPCVQCNLHIKYGFLLEIARRAGAQCLATGHYAVRRRDPAVGQWRLYKAFDRGKDQSYFLFALQQEVLRDVVWPLGGTTKARVRRLAADWGLPVANRGESQEICFVPGSDYRSFLKANLPAGDLQPGEVVDLQGNVLGTHAGIYGFTVGQRRGLGIPAPEALYVLRVKAGEGRLVVGPRSALDARVLSADGAGWVAGKPPAPSFVAEAQIRYRHRAAPARVEVRDADNLGISFLEPQRAITPGQAVVLYSDDEVLGGAWIKDIQDVPDG